MSFKHQVHMRELDRRALQTQNVRFSGRAGVSGKAGSVGAAPAFRDDATGTVYLSRFSSGCPAPCHVLDGLPEALVERRSRNGRVAAVKGSVIAGFPYQCRFYTRQQAASELA
ncbi:MAG: hypothetical protein U9R74_06520 [Pseudomonadota bacterium]|nr:hypothetical protein [Pseudomonadota bacterium]